MTETPRSTIGEQLAALVPPRPAAPALPVGRLARIRLTEPVRLYLYSVAVLIVAGLSLAGYLTGEWQDYATGAAAVLLGVVPATEAARSSVYSPRSIAALLIGQGR